MQWLNKIVDEIIAKHPEGEILVESGGSPSGTYHLGHLRELVIADAILLELKNRNRQAKHIYYVDDLDALRKIPVNVPTEFEKYLGRPLSNIPAPDGSDKSYSEYFVQDLVKAAEALSIEVEFMYTHDRYASGFFVSAIEKALEQVDTVRQVLENISGHKLGEEWSPIQINEDGYLKKRRFISFDKDNQKITYIDRDGQQRTTSYKNGEVKLDWRVDWPARWWLLDVQAEPFGRDHATKGGSYDTGAALCQDVFNHQPPIPVPYDFINLAGDNKKMSASKGTGLDAITAVRVLPAEIVRFFMLRYAPSKRLYFDPVEGVIRLIDDYAALLADPNKTEDEKKLIDLANMGKDSMVSSLPFSHLIASFQAARLDNELTISVLQRTPEYEHRVRAEKEIIKRQLSFIQMWLDNWAPEDVKFNIEENIEHLLPSFTEEEKNYLKALGDKVAQAPPDADGEWFHKAIYSFKDEHGLSPAELFPPLYRALINKEAGPRAGWFLSDLNRQDHDWLVGRLRLEQAT